MVYVDFAIGLLCGLVGAGVYGWIAQRQRDRGGESSMWALQQWHSSAWAAYQNRLQSIRPEYLGEREARLISEGQVVEVRRLGPAYRGDPWPWKSVIWSALNSYIYRFELRIVSPLAQEELGQRSYVEYQSWLGRPVRFYFDSNNPAEASAAADASRPFTAID